MAMFINFLVSEKFLSGFNQINLIGHSLGAHIAGIAGKNTNSKVAIIYGLDPANPLFLHDYLDGRLARNDAVETVVLHTNAGPLSLGYTWPIGKIDFYVNGGTDQPGCSFWSRLNDENGNPTPYLWNSCSHSRAHQIFAYSINSNSFVAYKCYSYDDAVDKRCNGPIVSFSGETGAKINYQGLYHFRTGSSFS
jgi:pancreatic triacylglycerol lipase